MPYGSFKLELRRAMVLEYSHSRIRLLDAKDLNANPRVVTASVFSSGGLRCRFRICLESSSDHDRDQPLTNLAFVYE